MHVQYIYSRFSHSGWKKKWQGECFGTETKILGIQKGYKKVKLKDVIVLFCLLSFVQDFFILKGFLI